MLSSKRKKPIALAAQGEDPREHLDTCDGCDSLLADYYIACDECGHWMHRENPAGFYYNPQTGESLCGVHQPKEDDDDTTN